MTQRGVLRCLVAAVLFGASAPAASGLAGEIPTLTLAGLLYVGAALAVLPIVLRHRPDPAGLRAGWRPLTIAVVFGGGLGPALLVAGLARTSAASTSLLLNCELLATLVISALVLHEHLGRRLLGAASLVAAAGVLLVWSPGAAFEVGGLLVVAACVCWGVDNAVTARTDQLRPEHITFAKGAVAGTVNLLLGIVLAGSAGIDLRQLLATLAIGALGYGASITLWVKGARDLGAARGQVIFATTPFIGAVLSWTVLGEPISAVQAVALTVAGAGVARSLGTGHEHRHRHVAIEHEHEHVHDDRHHDHLHDDGFTGRHTHRHRHEPLVHAHVHVPDLHHRHGH